MTLEHEAYRLDPDADKRPVVCTVLDLFKWETAHKAGSIDPLIMSPEFATCYAKLREAVEERKR